MVSLDGHGRRGFSSGLREISPAAAEGKGLFGLAVVHILMMLVGNPSGACGVLDSVGSGVYGALEFLF